MTAILDIPETTMNAARALAHKHGLTVEQYLLLAVTDRVSAEDESGTFFQERMATAKRGAWRAALARVPHRPADPRDAKL